MSNSCSYSKLKIIDNLTIWEKAVEMMINFCGYVFGYLTLAHRIVCGPLTIGPYGFRVQATSYIENGEKIWRRLESKEVLQTQFKGLSTLPEIFHDAVNRNGDSPFLGQRRILSEEKNESKSERRTLIKHFLSPFEWITYTQAKDIVIKWAKALEEMGFDQENKVGIFAETSQDWLMFALALLEVNVPIVTVYTTLCDEYIVHALHSSEVKGVMVDPKTKDRVINLLHRLPDVKVLFCSTKCDVVNNHHYCVSARKGGDQDQSSTDRNVQLISLNTFSTSSSITSHYTNHRPPHTSDVALIMYTSGSTGTPKGVVITHRSIISIMGGVCHSHKYWDNHTYPAYLPLAHILELCAEIGVLSFGGRIGYCSAQTLVDKAPMLQDGCPGDCTTLRPTTMIAVPLILERIKKSVLERIRAEKRIAKVIFQTAYNIRAHFLSHGYETPILNRLVFQRLRNVLGGRIRWGMVGGACLSCETEEFINVCFGTFKQSYGLTETCCGAAFSNVNYFCPCNCGPPIGCSELKLVAWEEGGFYPTNEGNPKGEIVVSGDNLSSGYYKDDELTNKAFKIDPVTKKRWFYTGDIGEILTDGTLRIIDRKKDIIKLVSGEYIPLVKVENALITSDLVDLACVLPNSLSNFLVALIVCNRASVGKLADSIQIKSTSSLFEDIIQDSDLVAAIKESINETIMKAGLTKHEIPRKMCLIEDIWTPESNLVTPSMKIKRVEISRRYANLLT